MRDETSTSMSDSPSSSPLSSASEEDPLNIYDSDEESYDNGENELPEDNDDGSTQDEDDYDEMEALSFSEQAKRRQRIASASSGSEEEIVKKPLRRKPLGSPRAISKPPARKIETSPRKISVPSYTRRHASVVPVRATSSAPRKVETQTSAKKIALPPTLYQYPGGLEVGEDLLNTIEDTLEDLYPGHEDNTVVARCAYFKIMYQSYYPIETQRKIEEVISLISNSS